MVVLHRNMEFPVCSLMPELVLGVPVHPAMFGVQLDEAIVAESLVIAALGDRVPVCLEKLVSEFLWNDEVFTPWSSSYRGLLCLH
jgi:hypothetical protein